MSTPASAMRVALTKAGRIAEACKITQEVVASPFASAYPEWQETLANVRTRHKRRSTVTVSRPKSNPINKARVRAAIGFMSANLHRHIALPELAKTVRLSSTYFSHLFKIETGIPPGEYLIKLRMEKAAQLLTTTFLSVKEVRQT